MTIRQATDSDFDALMELKMLCKEDEFRLSPNLRPPSETREHYARYLRQHLADSHCAVFVAVEDGRFAAMVQVRVYPSIPIMKSAQTGYISNLYVLEAHRRKGIGTQLVEHAVSWLREHGAGVVSLEIHIANRAAIELYRKAGFEDYTVKMSLRLLP